MTLNGNVLLDPAIMGPAAVAVTQSSGIYLHINNGPGEPHIECQILQLGLLGAWLERLHLKISHILRPACAPVLYLQEVGCCLHPHCRATSGVAWELRGQSLKPRAVSYLGIVNPACSRFLVADGSCLSCVRQINCFADRLHSIWASVSAMFMQLWIPVQVSSIWQGDEQIPGSPQHHFLLCQQSFAYPSLWAASLELLVELQSLWFSVQLALVAQPCSVPGGFSLLPCKVSGSNCFWECESSLNNKYLSCRSINLHGWLDGPCRCRCWGSIGRDLGTTAVTVSSILQSYPYRCAVILSTRII